LNYIFFVVILIRKRHRQTVKVITKTPSKW